MFVSENEFRNGKKKSIKDPIRDLYRLPSVSTVNYNTVLFHQPLGEDNEARLFNIHLKSHFSSSSKYHNFLKVYLKIWRDSEDAAPPPLLAINISTTDYSQCLTNTPLEVPQEFLKANFSLTGQIYGLNEQCRMLNGDNSSFCHFKSNNICSQLFCRKSNNEETCYASGPAVEGTTCGSGKNIF
ncbi:venom metallo ase 3-like [Brachionus plicatilis]|uniref:Venom metallo ase 3-like n=1 Tax=Brachionus plicatilis TaxID=10195 RepID=A0A3M7RAH6_BRAPC|nr:venom metallo ase 3-like [Brachionus plicatilis]